MAFGSIGCDAIHDTQQIFADIICALLSRFVNLKYMQGTYWQGIPVRYRILGFNLMRLILLSEKHDTTNLVTWKRHWLTNLQVLLNEFKSRRHHFETALSFKLQCEK